VCVCVCVCVWEREREGGGGGVWVLIIFERKGTIIDIILYWFVFTKNIMKTDVLSNN
jgi:hypothetical protein